MTIPEVIRPTTDSWQPVDLVRDVLASIDYQTSLGKFGRFAVVLSTAWRPYLKMKYTNLESVDLGCTLRERLERLSRVVVAATSNKLSQWDVALYHLEEDY